MSPYALRKRRLGIDSYSEAEVRLARQAFYAMSAHVDHQIRLVIGLLREEGLLDDTIVMFTADHGEMLGKPRPVGQGPLLRGLCENPDGPGAAVSQRRPGA